MNRFENMENFTKVVETGGISAAANRLGVAKSAVSRRLKELEAHLGVELFHRTTRKMNLTDIGQTFYQHCKRILEDVLEAELGVAQAHNELKGSLKVALPSSFGNMHVGPAVNEFLHLHPQIEFELDFNDREVDLMQEDFDLAIRIGKLADSSLIARRLAPIQTVLCASPAYLKRVGTPQSPADLLKHQCLVYTLIRDFEYWHMTATGGELVKTKLEPYLKATTGEYLRNAAMAGHGIALLPSLSFTKKSSRAA